MKNEMNVFIILGIVILNELINEDLFGHRKMLGIEHVNGLVLVDVMLDIKKE